MIKVMLLFLSIPILACQKAASLSTCVDGNGPCFNVINTSRHDFQDLQVASTHIGNLESGATSGMHQIDSIFNHVSARLTIDGTKYHTPFACFGFIKYTAGEFTVHISVIDDEDFGVRNITAELVEADN